MTLLAIGITPAAVEVFALLLALSVIVGLIARRLEFPYTLALVLIGLALGVLNVLPGAQLRSDVVLFVFLPVLLFEGSLTIDARALLANWLAVGLLAVPGLLLSLLIVAVVLHLGAGISWLDAGLIGAIISPTDPIAIVALLRQLGMATRLRTLIEGESLFNDGVGASAFVIVLTLLQARSGVSGAAADPWQLLAAALWLVLGGPLLGLVVGVVAVRLLRTVDDYLIEITGTFVVAYGVYAVAEAVGASGLLAVVCAGLVIGTFGRRTSMSERTNTTLQTVWEFAAYIANTLLFLLIGLQLGESTVRGVVGPIAWAVVGVLGGRICMVYLFLPLSDNIARRRSGKRVGSAHRVFDRLRPLPVAWRPLVVLSGLRGALSLALALSLPGTLGQVGMIRRIVFGVVLVTLVGQGIGMRVLLPRITSARATESHDAGATPERRRSDADSH